MKLDVYDGRSPTKAAVEAAEITPNKKTVTALR